MLQLRVSADHSSCHRLLLKLTTEFPDVDTCTCGGTAGLSASNSGNPASLDADSFARFALPKLGLVIKNLFAEYLVDQGCKSL
jgi:hypothetical protein